MPRFAVIFVAILGTTMADWQRYKEVHGKSYSGEEEEFRRGVYEEKLAMINANNILHDLKIAPYRMGVNQFTDMAAEEVENLRCLNVDPAALSARSQEFKPELFDGDLPKTVDWRDKGYVTPVKNQMQCGSCWAFSATGAIEGQHFRATQQLVSLSEQDILDCSVSPGNHGCGGGSMITAFEDIKTMGGIDTEESYPYLAHNDTCHFKAECVGATVSGHVMIPSGDEAALQIAVARIGPVSVGIDVTEKFLWWGGDVFIDDACRSDYHALDHAVLVVGYGTDDGTDYWLVKNSWGPLWGQDGYIKMARNRNNHCGIATAAVYPTV